MEIREIVQNQRDYFNSKITYDVSFRIQRLQEIKSLLFKYQEKFIKAFKKDYNKCAFDVLTTEFGLVIQEINYMLKHIKKLTKVKKAKTSIVNFPSKGYIVQEPYGVVLIMAPWNYPLQLSLEPLIGAIAAGNTVVLKPASYTANVSKVIYDMFKEFNRPELIHVVLGGRQQNQELLEQRFDYIFFTGGKVVGKIVYEKAMEKMIPFSLELGGKSPCIVDNTAKIKLSAKRIVFGKLLNAGQTCVAPDYLYCHEDIKDELVKEIIHQIKEQYGDNPLQNDAFGKMISKRHFDKVVSLMENQNIIYGGKFDETSLKIEPTIIDNPKLDSLIMQEEIFGPLLPVITFKNIDEVIKYVNNGDSPLALYYFSKNKKDINKVISHLATSHMPFGGVGASGIGAYHGKVGFDTFVHYKSIVDKKTILDLPMRYQPYKKVNDKLIRMFLK